MGRHNHRRSETSATTVRLSPGEREALLEKAGKAGIRTKSAAIRAAVEAWTPQCNTESVEQESLPEGDNDVDNVLPGGTH